MSLKDEPIVEYIQHWGADLTTVNSARCSFGKQVGQMRTQDVGLINYLADHGHSSPFRHSGATFRITCPIFIARQIHKHQVGVCVDGDTLIKTRLPNGSIREIPISKLHDWWENGRTINTKSKTGKQYRRTMSIENTRKEIRNMTVVACNTDNNYLKTASIKNVLKSGVKNCIEVRDEEGNTITLTKDHQVWTPEGWTEAGTLKVGSDIGRNGLSAVGKGEYQNKQQLHRVVEESKNVQEVADKFGISYHTARKWMRIHGLQGFFDTTFKKGVEPWNKGKKGYIFNAQWSEESRESVSQARRGSKSNFFKTGKYINHWNGKRARIVRRLFETRGNKCEVCGEEISEEYAVHHIIPRKQRPSLELVDDNLALLHRSCHQKLHSDEALFFSLVEKRYGSTERVVFETPPGNRKKVKWAKVVAIKEVGPRAVYDLTMDDEHHNFVGNGFVLHNCINEISGRYVYMTPEDQWHPDKWRAIAPNVKQGSSEEEIADSDRAWEVYLDALATASDAYRELCKLGVCREQARAVLPQAQMTQFWMTASLQAWAHFYNLRSEEHAQAEVREYAEQVAEVMYGKFPYSWKALTGYTPSGQSSTP